MDAGITYDGFGNLYQKTGTGLAAGWSADWMSYLISAKNQLGSHDANGNPVGASFDVENRLTTQGAYSFGYAPDNKRIMRVRPDGLTAYHTEIHFYSGSNRLGKYKVSFPEGGSSWEIQTLAGVYCGR